MDNISDLIKMYMNTWVKCSKCLEMCKIELTDTINSNNTICIYCKEEEK